MPSRPTSQHKFRHNVFKTPCFCNYIAAAIQYTFHTTVPAIGHIALRHEQQHNNNNEDLRMCSPGKAKQGSLWVACAFPAPS